MKKPLIKRLKGTAFFTLICFSVSTLASASPAVLSPQAPDSSEVLQNTLAAKIQIPEEYGQISGRFVAPRAVTTVIHIQDAHANLSAQASIRKILHYLNSNYQVNQVYLEGAMGDLDPSLVNVFKEKELNEKAAAAFEQAALIGGAERFLIDADESNEKAAGNGIEALDLYKKNLEQFRRVYSLKPKTGIVIEKVKSEILTESSKVLNKSLKVFFREWLFFQKHQENFSRHIAALEAAGRKYLGLDLKKPQSQAEWPQLARLVRIQKLEGKIDLPRAAEEKARLEQWINVHAQAGDPGKEWATNFKGLLEAAVNGQAKTAAPRLTAEKFYHLYSSQGFSFETYPELSKSLGKKILESELSPEELMKETRALSDQLLEKMADSPEAKEWVKRFRHLLLLEKLLGLELSREEYLSLQSDSAKFKPLEFSRKLKVTDRNILEKALREALSFYETAVEREAAIEENMLSGMKARGSETAVLVTGGFHSEGIAKRLSRKGISFVEITPRITDLKEVSDYFRVMTLGDASASATVKEPTYLELPLLQKVLPAHSRYFEKMGQRIIHGLKPSPEAFDFKSSAVRSESREDKDYFPTYAKIKAAAAAFWQKTENSRSLLFRFLTYRPVLFTNAALAGIFIFYTYVVAPDLDQLKPHKKYEGRFNLVETVPGQYESGGIKISDESRMGVIDKVSTRLTLGNAIEGAGMKRRYQTEEIKFTRTVENGNPAVLVVQVPKANEMLEGVLQTVVRLDAGGNPLPEDLSSLAENISLGRYRQVREFALWIKWGFLGIVTVVGAGLMTALIDWAKSRVSTDSKTAHEASMRDRSTLRSRAVENGLEPGGYKNDQRSEMRSLWDLNKRHVNAFAEQFNEKWAGSGLNIKFEDQFAPDDYWLKVVRPQGWQGKAWSGSIQYTGWSWAFSSLEQLERLGQVPSRQMTFFPEAVFVSKDFADGTQEYTAQLDLESPLLGIAADANQQLYAVVDPEVLEKYQAISDPRKPKLEELPVKLISSSDPLLNGLFFLAGGVAPSDSVMSNEVSDPGSEIRGKLQAQYEEAQDFHSITDPIISDLREGKTQSFESFWSKLDPFTGEALSVVELAGLLSSVHLLILDRAVSDETIRKIANILTSKISAVEELFPNDDRVHIPWILVDIERAVPGSTGMEKFTPEDNEANPFKAAENANDYEIDSLLRKLISDDESLDVETFGYSAANIGLEPILSLQDENRFFENVSEEYLEQLFQWINDHPEAANTPFRAAAFGSLAAISRFLDRPISKHQLQVFREKIFSDDIREMSIALAFFQFYWEPMSQDAEGLIQRMKEIIEDNVNAPGDTAKLRSQAFAALKVYSYKKDVADYIQKTFESRESKTFQMSQPSIAEDWPKAVQLREHLGLTFEQIKWNEAARDFILSWKPENGAQTESEIDLKAAYHLMRIAEQYQNRKMNIGEARREIVQLNKNGLFRSETRNPERMFSLAEKLQSWSLEQVPQYLNIQWVKDRHEYLRKILNDEQKISQAARDLLDFPERSEWGRTLTPELIEELDVYLKSRDKSEIETLRRKFPFLANNPSLEQEHIYLLANLLEWSIWRKAGVSLAELNWQFPVFLTLKPLKAGEAGNQPSEIKPADFVGHPKELMQFLKFIDASQEILIETFTKRSAAQILTGPPNNRRYGAEGYEFLALGSNDFLTLFDGFDRWNETSLTESQYQFLKEKQSKVEWSLYANGGWRPERLAEEINKGKLNKENAGHFLEERIQSNRKFVNSEWPEDASDLDPIYQSFSALKAQGYSEIAEALWAGIYQRFSNGRSEMRSEGALPQGMSAKQVLKAQEFLQRKGRAFLLEKLRRSSEPGSDEDLVQEFRRALIKDAPLEHFTVRERRVPELEEVLTSFYGNLNPETIQADAKDPLLQALHLLFAETARSLLKEKNLILPGEERIRAAGGVFTELPRRAFLQVTSSALSTVFFSGPVGAVQAVTQVSAEWAPGNKFNEREIYEEMIRKFRDSFWNRLGAQESGPKGELWVNIIRELGQRYEMKLRRLFQLYSRETAAAIRKIQKKREDDSAYDPMRFYLLNDRFVSLIDPNRASPEQKLWDAVWNLRDDYSWRLPKSWETVIWEMLSETDSQEILAGKGNSAIEKTLSKFSELKKRLLVQKKQLKTERLQLQRLAFRIWVGDPALVRELLRSRLNSGLDDSEDTEWTLGNDRYEKALRNGVVADPLFRGGSEERFYSLDAEILELERRWEILKELGIESKPQTSRILDSLRAADLPIQFGASQTRSEMRSGLDQDAERRKNIAVEHKGSVISAEEILRNAEEKDLWSVYGEIADKVQALSKKSGDLLQLAFFTAPFTTLFMVWLTERNGKLNGEQKLSLVLAANGLVFLTFYLFSLNASKRGRILFGFGAAIRDEIEVRSKNAGSADRAERENLPNEDARLNRSEVRRRSENADLQRFRARRQFLIAGVLGAVGVFSDLNFEWAQEQRLGTVPGIKLNEELEKFRTAQMKVFSEYLAEGRGAYRDSVEHKGKVIKPLIIADRLDAAGKAFVPGEFDYRYTQPLILGMWAHILALQAAGSLPKSAGVEDPLLELETLVEYLLAMQETYHAPAWLNPGMVLGQDQIGFEDLTGYDGNLIAAMDVLIGKLQSVEKEDAGRVRAVTLRLMKLVQDNDAVYEKMYDSETGMFWGDFNVKTGEPVKGRRADRIKTNEVRPAAALRIAMLAAKDPKFETAWTKVPFFVGPDDTGATVINTWKGGAFQYAYPNMYGLESRYREMEKLNENAARMFIRAARASSNRTYFPTAIHGLKDEYFDAVGLKEVSEAKDAEAGWAVPLIVPSFGTSEALTFMKQTLPALNMNNAAAGGLLFESKHGRELIQTHSAVLVMPSLITLAKMTQSSGLSNFLRSRSLHGVEELEKRVDRLYEDSAKLRRQNFSGEAVNKIVPAQRSEAREKKDEKNDGRHAFSPVNPSESPIEVVPVNRERDGKTELLIESLRKKTDRFDQAYFQNVVFMMRRMAGYSDGTLKGKLFGGGIKEFLTGLTLKPEAENAVDRDSVLRVLKVLLAPYLDSDTEGILYNEKITNFILDLEQVLNYWNPKRDQPGSFSRFKKSLLKLIKNTEQDFLQELKQNKKSRMRKHESRNTIFREFASDFDEKGLAENDRAKKLSLKMYQQAIEEFAAGVNEIKSINNQAVDLRLDGLFGSFANQTARIGIFPKNVTFRDAKEKAGVSTRDKAKGKGQWPSDIDVSVDFGVGLLSRQGFKISDELEVIAERIYKKTGVVIHHAPVYPAESWNRVPVEQLIHGHFFGEYLSRSEMRPLLTQLKESNLNPSEVEELNQTASQAMTKILEELAKYDPLRVKRDIKIDGGLVTEADHAIQKKLMETVLTKYPTHFILGEETLEGELAEKNKANRNSDYVWIIDPIDGTSAFAKGLPDFAVAFGLFYRGRPVLSKIYTPALGEILSAVQGKQEIKREMIEGLSKNNREPQDSKVILAAVVGESAAPEAWRRLISGKAFDGKTVQLMDRHFSTVVRSAKTAIGDEALYADLRNEPPMIWDIAPVAYFAAKAGAKVLLWDRAAGSAGDLFEAIENDLTSEKTIDEMSYRSVVVRADFWAQYKDELLPLLGGVSNRSETRKGNDGAGFLGRNRRERAVRDSNPSEDSGLVLQRSLQAQVTELNGFIEELEKYPDYASNPSLYVFSTSVTDKHFALKNKARIELQAIAKELGQPYLYQGEMLSEDFSSVIKRLKEIKNSLETFIVFMGEKKRFENILSGIVDVLELRLRQIHFYLLLELLNRRGWILQGEQRTSKGLKWQANDHIAFEFQNGRPDLSAVLRWDESAFEAKIKILSHPKDSRAPGIIPSRINDGFLIKLRILSKTNGEAAEDLRKMADLIQRIPVPLPQGVSIAPSGRSETRENDKKVPNMKDYLRRNGIEANALFSVSRIAQGILPVVLTKEAVRELLAEMDRPKGEGRGKKLSFAKASESARNGNKAQSALIAALRKSGYGWLADSISKNDKPIHLVLPVDSDTDLKKLAEFAVLSGVSKFDILVSGVSERDTSDLQRTVNEAIDEWGGVTEAFRIRVHAAPSERDLRRLSQRLLAESRGVKGMASDSNEALEAVIAMRNVKSMRSEKLKKQYDLILMLAAAYLRDSTQEQIYGKISDLDAWLEVRGFDPGAFSAAILAAVKAVEGSA